MKSKKATLEDLDIKNIYPIKEKTFNEENFDFSIDEEE